MSDPQEPHTISAVDHKPNDRDVEKGPIEAHEGSPKENSNQHPGPKTLATIIFGMYTTLFLVALDRTIIGTAIPTITNEFDSLGDVGWYGSAYMLTNCAFQLLLGRVYTFYSPKAVYLAMVVIFEIGSAICGAAPTSTAFIIGRAVAGIGSAGIFSGCIVILVNLVPLSQRPKYQGLLGSVFGIGSIVGPLLGGAFTDHISWRWCFYINLPIGAVSMLLVVAFLKFPEDSKRERLAPKQQFLRLDPIGTLCLMPGIICLLLALQWGGSTYDWSNARIIVLFILFGILAISFVAVQTWNKDNATVPVRIIRQRSIAAGLWYNVCSGGVMMILVYFLPIWFQAIKDVSPVKSGIMLVPLVLGLVVASISAGFLTTKIGYYAPPLLVGCALLCVGTGLMTTFETDTGHAKWIGYQVLYGFGTGLAMQQPSVAAQTILARKDVPTGVSLMIFGQNLGGSIWLSVGQNVFTNRLVDALPDAMDPSTVVHAGATELRRLLGEKMLPEVLSAYNIGITSAFEVATGVACAAMLGALAIEWRSVKAKSEK